MNDVLDLTHFYPILASEKEISKATEAEQKFQSIKRELDDFKLKNKKQKVSQNDVRLQRALEEVKFFLYQILFGNWRF